MKDKPFALIGVSSTASSARRRRERTNSTGAVSRTSRRARVEDLRPWYIRGWPTIVVLDAERKIHYRGHNGEEATRIAERLVAGMEKAGKLSRC